MQFINPVHLITKTTDETLTNDIGDVISNKNSRKVLAYVTSIKQNEFYQAQANGFKPELTFICRSFEYKGEELVNYNGKEYKLIRTYDKGDGTIELVCTGVVNNVST